jgi:hypothetical protein
MDDLAPSGHSISADAIEVSSRVVEDEDDDEFEDESTDRRPAHQSLITNQQSHLTSRPRPGGVGDEIVRVRRSNGAGVIQV